jgi:hypothetical protein
MPNTYTAIATQTLGSAAASYTFTSIPSTYTDLILVVNGTITSGALNVNIQLNSDTGSNYSDTGLTGNGSAASSGRDTNDVNFWFGVMGTSQTAQIYNFMNYANTTTYKTVLARSSNAAAYVQAHVGLWRSTAAINSIKLFPYTTNTFTAGSTFSLYGILAA